MGLKLELGHGRVGHFDAGRIGINIESGRDFQASGGAGGADKADDRFEIDEWPPAPIMLM